jgi:hypothetical protein
MAAVKSGPATPLSRNQMDAIITAFLSGRFINDICRNFHHAPKTVYRVLDAEGLRGGVPIDEVEL